MPRRFFLTSKKIYQMEKDWVKITDNSKNGGKVWAWVSVAGTVITLTASNMTTILNWLATVFGIK